MEQLSSSGSYAEGNTQAKNTEIVLERWRVELKPTSSIPTDDFGPTLPTIYKKAIIFFRSFFATTRLLPAWKFASQGVTRNPHPALVPRCRIRTSEPRRHGPDLLRHPVDGKSDPVTDYLFGDLDVPIGRLSVSVTYRNDCSFRIDDSEALLSSRFMGVDENFFKPSLPQRTESARKQVAEVGSLRDHRQQVNLSDVHQTYGSLSTFHGDGPLGTSPLSALKSVRAPGSETSSPPSSLPVQHDVEPPHSLPIASRASTSRPAMQGHDGSTGRRPSVSFQPFKAGSLSGSPIPRQSDSDPPPSPQSLQRASGPPSLQQPRNRTSLTAGMPASLRGGPPQPPTPQSGEPPGGSSPRPGSTSRYSSSFTHRRGRLSIGGMSKGGDDEQGSSGRQSLSSSVAQPGSGLLAEPGASSGSLQAEEDNISDFLKALDSKKTLKSFDQPKRGESATNKTVAQLSKFHMMKESNNALTESMTSSVQMHRSSSSSSRQLTSVPGMVAPASVSASSSPSKPHSPHTPHTPAIPSRLSENSTADNASESRRFSSRRSRPSESTVPESSRENTLTQAGTMAIDIPTSPGLGSYQRRASSVAQESRALLDDEGAELPFAANRSLSLGADDREGPTISGLLGRQLEAESAARQEQLESLQPAAEIRATETSDVMQRGELSEENPPDGFMAAPPSSSPYGRRRYTGMGTGRRQTPEQSTRGSFTGSGTRLGREDNESLSGEPLVFDLSEMDAQSRKSLEEARGGGHAGAERGSYEHRGASRR